jgi:hypothetical protein
MYDGPPPTPRSPLPATATPAPSPATAFPSLTPTSLAPTLAMPSGATVTLDHGLLAILPATVGGVPVNEEAESLTEAVKDSGFVASVDRAVFALAVSGNDLASGVVAHLRPGVWSDKFFADWRATYDEGACSQAGGALAHSQTTAAGRTVYVTTCAGGLRVYHAYLQASGVVVSLFSLGDKRFGDQIMSQLRG